MKNFAEIPFRTLTPLWTGGANRSSDIVHETGLLGSLRWWYEGVIRGLGGHACNYSGDGKRTCQLNVKEYKDGRKKTLYERQLLTESGLCPVCMLFGTTGWQRGFRLEVKGLSPQPLFFMASPKVYVAAGNWLWRMFGGRDTGGEKIGKGDKVEFIFGSRVLWGEQATMAVVPLGEEAENIKAKLFFLIDLIQRFGSWGAKCQNGFGFIDLGEPMNEELVREGRRLIEEDIAANKRYGQNQEKRGQPDSIAASSPYFDMRNFFSRTYQLANTESYVNGLRKIGKPGEQNYRNRYIPCAFDIRYKSQQKNPFTGQGRNFGLRPWFREFLDDDAAQQLFGKSDAVSDSERTAGRIRVSHLFRFPGKDSWHVRVWGDVPNKLDKSEVIQTIHDFIQGDKGMFPGSELISEFNFQEVLGQ